MIYDTSTYQIEYDIALVNFENKQAIDIKRILAEFNFYENIFSNTLTCDLVILDAVGLIDRFPIVGNEKIVLAFKSKHSDNQIVRTFDIYKISNRTQLEERLHSYVIYGVSAESVANQTKLLSQSFPNQSIDQIVNKIFNEYIEPVNNKTIDVEPTNGLQSFVFNKTPFESINQLASEAVSSLYPDTSSYVFYEDRDGFKFRSIGSMIETDPVEDYYYGVANIDELYEEKSERKPYQIIVSLGFEKTFDVIKGLQLGLYDNRVLSIDPILKKFNQKVFRYAENFPLFNHLGNNKIVDDFGRFSFEEGHSHRRFLGTQIGEDYNNLSYLENRIDQTSDPFLSSPRQRQKFLNNALSQLSTFSQYTINVTVPGNHLLKAGDTIRLYIPQNSDIKEDETKYIKLFGQDPKFLISAVKHNYKNTDTFFTTTISCVKESFGKPITSEYQSIDLSNEG